MNDKYTVTIFDVVNKRDKLKNASDYLLGELGTSAETVLLTDDEVKMLIASLDEVVTYYENYLDSIAIPI